MQIVAMDGIPIALFIVFTARIAHGASCNTKFSDAYFLSFFGLKASSETTKNKASDAFTVGWCATTKASPNLEVDFKNPYGISGIHISGPTNRDGDPYPTSVLVKYVPNGGDVNTFVHFPLQEGKLVINMTTFGTVQSNFGQGIAVRKLQFTIQSFHGDACLKIDLIGCTIHDLCTYGCQNNGLCVMQDTCQCALGYLGNNCEKHACEPVDLGLADGTIGADHIQVSSEDPVYNKAELGNSDSKKGWCPSLTDHFPWVQIKLDQPKALSIFNFMWSDLGGQNIMTEFELQYIAPIDSSKRFRTFATNIPAMNGTHIFTIAIQPVVVTDTIRITATNWDNRACFKLKVKGCDPTVLCSSGWCQNGGTCMGENVCLCPSGYVGSRCETLAKQIAVTNMTFVKIENHVIITTAAALQFTVTGNVKLDVVGNKPIVTINGTDSCIKLNQTTGVPSCITDVNLCPNGFTFTIDVNFGHLLDNTYIVSSGGLLPGHSGITLYYTNKHLHYIVSTNKKVWTLVVPYKPVLHIWQHFEITWNKHLGVELLIDGHSLGSNSRPSVQPTSTQTFNLYIGCSLTPATVNTNMQITAIHAWTIDRTELVNAGVKDPPATATTHLPTTPTTVAETTPPIKTATTTTLHATTPPSFLQYNLTFVTVVDNLLITPTFNFTLHNKPVLELQNNSQTAIVLDCSNQQYVELPDTGVPCLENLDDCEKGFTFKLDVMFTKFEPAKKAYILSSGGDVSGASGMAIYIHNSQMIFGVKQGLFHWTGTYNITGIVKTDIWYKLEVSWSAQKGELVLINGYQVIKSNQWTTSPVTAATNPVLIGKTEGSNETTCMKVRDMFIWTTEREVLVDHVIVKVPEATTLSTVRPTASSTMTSVTRTSKSLTSLTFSTYFQRYTTMPSASTSVQYLKLEDAISAKCTSYGWNISMDLSILWFLYPGITVGDIYLSSAKCNGTILNDKLWFQQSFETCATREEVVDGAKVFRNVLFYASFDNLDPTIVRQHFWTYSIACYVSNGEATSSHLHHEVESHSTNITAHRDISMTFFKDRNFLHQVSGNPLRVTVGDNVYVKVSTSIPDWSTKMRLHTCYTRSSDNTVAEHILIRDGCEVDSNTHIISQSTHDTKFVFRDFEYLTFNEGLDIFCNATFCDTSDYTSACTQACRQSPPIVG